MKGFQCKMMAAGLALALLATVPASFAQQYQRVYDAKAHKYVYTEKPTLGNRISTGAKKAWKDPAVRKGVIGAGIGLGAAALTDRSLLKGGLIGAGVGAGWGLMDKSATMQQKPLLRYVSKGALAGAGVGAATGGMGVLPAAVLGAGAGAATHYVKTH
jgi:hypothetical protein